MVNIDIGNGVATFTPPAVVAGEVAARVFGLTINEWFYIVAIACMLVSTVASTAVAVLKAKNKKGVTNE
ncbi:hypothetical protein [Delftia phage IME-DE1]|uniref:Holin n=1 Tax=Delftia phage IME-DE1 TaxID=1647385 RepID=A0A0F7IJU9_9CAUD|nr:holin [Delftia phage IME-DE1]AKG94470.1 hypothetical protein [Delftia phage IME-DE1]